MAQSSARIWGIGSLRPNNNRVFTQLRFLNNISFGDTILYTPLTTDTEMAFAVWDYDGHELMFITYGCSNFYNAPTQLHVMDSAVYLGGVVYDDATFGTHVVPNYGNSTVYIAKYVDTAFMTPYVWQDTAGGGTQDTTHPGPDTGDVRITLVAGGNAIVAYPNPFRQRVTIRIENGALKHENGVATAWLTDLQGRREEVRLTPTAPSRYTLDLTARPQSTYLLTLTTADGQQHTLRLFKQSDIFGK